MSDGKDGPHTIYPYAPDPAGLNVVCDQETNNGGWIIYQRRVDGTLNFTRNWAQYSRGFWTTGGNMTELWLGNEKVYQLLHKYGSNEVTLRIELDAFDGARGWIEVSDFKMADGSHANKYGLHWNRCNASGGSDMVDSWNAHMDLTFKTHDKVDNRQHCFDNHHTGGWWYSRQCGTVLLNGEYINSATTNTTKSIYVRNFSGHETLRRSRMMFRLTKPAHNCSNPCRNGATCEHVTNPRGHRCVCTFQFCGTECELDNPCKNGGTCKYNETTNSTTCMCPATFVGAECENSTLPAKLSTTLSATPQPITPPPTTPPQPTTQPTTPPQLTTPPTTPTTTGSTTFMIVVGGILLMSLLIACDLVVYLIYTRRQRMERNEPRHLAEHLEAGFFQDYMLSIFGF